MPGPLVIPAIAAGASIFNTLATAGTNASERRYNDRQQWRQRIWALEDWERQNAYNSPAAQMQRLRDAGLNPNLVYGNGATATSSQMPRGADAKSYNPKAPQLDATGPAHLFLLQQMQNKEMELKDAQIATGWSDNALKNAQIIQTLQGVEGSKQELGQRIRLADTAVAQALANLESTRAGTTATQVGTDISLDRNDREAAQNASNLKEATERILKSQAERGKITQDMLKQAQEILNSQLQNQIMQEDLKLKQKGQQPGDWIWWKKVDDMINDLKRRMDGRNQPPTEMQKLLNRSRNDKMKYEEGWQ